MTVGVRLIRPWVGFSDGRSLADLFLAIRPCACGHHLDLADDLGVAHLQRRVDPHPAAVRVLARLPERHPILAGDSSLDSMRRLRAQHRSQVLGDLCLPAKLEGCALQDPGVDDAQLGVLGVEAQDELRGVTLDGAAQSFEVQPVGGFRMRHTVYLLPGAPGRPCSIAATPAFALLLRWYGSTTNPSWAASSCFQRGAKRKAGDTVPSRRALRQGKGVNSCTPLRPPLLPWRRYLGT